MTKHSTSNVMVALAGSAVLFTAFAATAAPKPPKDLVCLECVESEEIDGTLDANVLDPSVMVEGENVSSLNNDAGYLVSGDVAAQLGRVIFLSGDDSAANNGAALQGAIDDIIAEIGLCSAPAPSATDPCLIKLGPGVYELDNTLNMRSFVDIEGSGEGATVISGSPPDLANSLVRGADAELRYLTVDNTKANNPLAVPVRAIVTGGNNMRITHVTAIANGANNSDRNVGIGVLGGSDAPVLSHVTAITQPSSFTTARAIEVGDGAQPQLIDVTAISADQALTLLNSDSELVTVRDSHLQGAVFSVVAFDQGANVVNIHASQLEGTLSSSGGSTVNLGASQLDGTASEISGGTINCVFVYDGNFVAHACN